MNIGVVGCGNISDIYFTNAGRFDVLHVLACADLDPSRAAEKAKQYDLPSAYSLDELLADPEIELVVNITPPQAHVEISLRALEAGKHVYSEKPLALNREDGRRILDLAQAKNLRVGCAPDTFMGAGLQTCRKIMDAGQLGRPVAATAFMLCPGHEKWHPNPAFFYQQGGGPVFDMGPYYLTALVNLMGAVERVSAVVQTTFPERVIESEAKEGQKISVNTPTHVSAVLEFENGAMCTMIMSFDVWHHHLPPMEIYCEDGTLNVPDPNCFGGVVRMRTARGKSWKKITPTHGYEENSRGVGLADMAVAIASGREHRAKGELAYHVLDIMESIYDSARVAHPVDVVSRCAMPARMSQGLAFGQIGD